MMDTDRPTLWKLLKRQYLDIWVTLKSYFDVYGGWRTLCSSPYLHLSLLLTALSYSQWSREKWYETVTGIMPNLLGFTLAGYAVILSFGDEKFRALISQKGRFKYSPFLNYSATFLHFVIIQALALTFAVVCKSMSEWMLPYIANFTISLLGYWIFLYSLCFSISAGMAIYKLGKAFEKVKSQEPRHQDRLQSIRDAKAEILQEEQLAEAVNQQPTHMENPANTLE